MSNPNPRIENLALGRGQKPKLGHQSYKFNISPEDKDRLEMIAEAYGCTYAGKGSISALLTKIARDELIIAPSPSYVTVQNTATSNQEREKKRKRILDQDLLDRNKSKLSGGESSEKGFSQRHNELEESNPRIDSSSSIAKEEKTYANC
ncbi:MAG: hypothetical protein ACK58N_07450 [Synechocystis sp.]